MEFNSNPTKQEAFLIQDEKGLVLAVAHCGSTIQWSTQNELTPESIIIAVRHGFEHENFIFLLAKGGRAVTLTGHSRLEIKHRTFNGPLIIDGREVFGVKYSLPTEGSEHFFELLGRNGNTVLKRCRRASLSPHWNACDWLIHDRLKLARDQVNSMLSENQHHKVDFPWPVSLRVDRAGQDSIAPLDKRVCVITTGVDRFFQSSSYILKQQLQLDRLTSADFWGMFWKTKEGSRGRDFPLKSLFDSFNCTFVDPITFCDPLVGQESLEHLVSIESIPLLNATKALETNLNNMLSMFYLRQRLLDRLIQKRVLDGNQYDAYIFVRTDVILRCGLEWEGIFEALNTSDVIISVEPRFRGGINDQVCIATAAGMRHFLSVYSKIHQYAQNGVLLHPETMLKHHLQEQGVLLHFEDSIDTFIVRQDSHFSLSFRVEDTRAISPKPYTKT